MFSHVTLGTNDFARSKRFWEAVSGALDLPMFYQRDDRLCYGTATGPKIFIGNTFDGQPASAGNGTHVAFLAKDRASVDPSTPPRSPMAERTRARRG